VAASSTHRTPRSTYKPNARSFLFYKIRLKKTVSHISRADHAVISSRKEVVAVVPAALFVLSMLKGSKPIKPDNAMRDKENILYTTHRWRDEEKACS
jgi:hypothetical protein